MKTKYFVKQTSVATDENENFRGQCSVAIYGKDQHLVSHSGTHAKATNDEFDFIDYCFEDYGYVRECDARRSWIYRNPENTKWWSSTVEIIKVTR